MPRRRDRHDRGLRGPLALPNRFTNGSVPLQPPASRAAHFMECLDAAIAKVNRSCPEVLRAVDIGIEEVPVAVVQWSRESIPLAAAVEASADRPAQIVVYRRPLEHRAASRSGLRILVHRTLVEQLAALTGRSTSEIDPFSDPDDEW